MNEKGTSPNLTAESLAALSIEDLLHRLQLNYGFAQFAGVSSSDLREREELLIELSLRVVPEEVITAAIERGCREGASIAAGDAIKHLR